MGKTTGTQSMRRALALLRLLANHQARGLDLQTVVQQSGLERSTAHRLLSSLVQEQFVEREAESRRYRLGIDAMQLGFAALRRVPMLDTLRPFAQRLARRSGDTIFMMMRSGDHALCLLRESGGFFVKVFTMDEGERRLLGIGAGGLALLAGLTDAEIAAIHARHAQAYSQSGKSMTTLMRNVAHVRKQGYSETIDTITPGVSDVGTAFAISELTTVAFSLAAINSRLGAERRSEMGDWLRSECQAWLHARHDAQD